MNKIRNFLMLMAVVVAVTGAFAFNTPKHKLSGTQYTVTTLVSQSGSTVTFSGQDISGDVEGVDFDCNNPRPEVICFLELTDDSVVTDNHDGTFTITNVIIHYGDYTP